MKKILCTATALILAFGLTACGSGTGAPASSGQTAAGTSAGTSASGTAAPDSAEGNENAGPGRENIAAGSAANITPGSADATDAAEFSPALDTSTSCRINVAGSYKNFEALESAFIRFNEYYPDVELSFTRLDDYNHMISTALEGGSAPDIYVSYSWMMGRGEYAPVFEHAENLADPSLSLDLECLRPNILTWSGENDLRMIPVFSTTYGMMINLDLFEKEGLQIPTTREELAAVCDAFREKGFSSPVMGYNGTSASTSSFLYSLAYPYFCKTVSDDPAAVEALNRLDPAAGEYLRPALEMALGFVEDKFIDLPLCTETFEDGYEAVIMRFFEGDVPMMICTGDTVSGTRKREGQSEAFTKNPFRYCFMPVPVTEDGGIFLDLPSLEFSVNKDSESLAMCNEFMRFLVTPAELGNMAEIKRLVTPTKNLSFDSVYAPFGEVPADMVVSPEEFGLTDDPVTQLRAAVIAVANGEMTIDEAVGETWAAE